MKYHLRIDVRSALKKTDDHLRGMFNINGTPAEGRLCRKQLEIFLSRGREFISADSNCDNWDEQEQACGGHADGSEP